jgi:hypothetical protein
MASPILIFRAFKFVVLLSTLSKGDIRWAILKSLPSNFTLIPFLMESTHPYCVKCVWASRWMLLLNFCLQVTSDSRSGSVSLILLDATSILLFVSKQLETSRQGTRWTPRHCHTKLSINWISDQVDMLWTWWSYFHLFFSCLRCTECESCSLNCSAL